MATPPGSTATPDANEILRALGRFAQNSKLFALLDSQGIVKLAHVGRLERRPKDYTVVRQGELGNAFYMLSSGEVRVVVAAESGGRTEEAALGKEVARLGPGSFFGEIGVMTRQPRTATVVTTRPSELIRFERQAVSPIFEIYPKVKEVLGSVGLQRSEANMAQALAEDEDAGLADLLEGKTGEHELPDPGDLAEEPTEDSAGGSDDS